MGRARASIGVAAVLVSVTVAARPAYAVETDDGLVAACDDWTATNLSGAPAGRSWFTAVWTGSEVIVWGGENGTALSSGGRYDPVSDTWMPTSTAGACPTARAAHSAVWTGSEMIVWGGGGTTPVNTGGRYSPASDTWIATSVAAPCPTERGAHTAVWTGSRMIVWGGETPSGYENTGGAYDPATDTWTATAIGGACPSPRGYHIAVWTGTEMIVWGGAVPPGYFSTGGRYDPATDSWTPTSTATGCPSARALHAAVWTGSEMIVWGGAFFGSTYLDTGGRYSPATDTWTATSLAAPCPSARSNHTAIWTGNEMIVWGGHGNGPQNTGGRYCPAVGGWTTTPTTGACPAPRENHEAVWTGDGMVVWGGSQLSSGGLYRYIDIAPAALPDATLGIPYSQTLTATGGTPPHSFSLASGALPAGLALSPAGVLSGTPTSLGASSFAIAATDSSGCIGARSYWLLVQGSGCAGVTITVSPATLSSGVAGTPYSQTLTAAGGAAPYSFAVAAGPLPPGLSLSTGGALTGTPTAAGTFTFGISATDANSCVGSQDYVLAISQSSCLPITISPSTLPDGLVGAPYTTTLTAVGGLAPYSYQVIAGTLPAGLALASSGLLSGTPVAPGAAGFQVQATDVLGCTGLVSLTIIIRLPSDYVSGEGLGLSSGNTNRVRVHRSDGTPTSVDFQAYGAGKWGTNVASGAIGSSPSWRILTGPGPGSVYGPQVRAFSETGSPIAKVSYYAYATLKFGVNVAAGDVDGDLYAEIVTGAGPGAVFSPHVRGWNVDNGGSAPMAKISFFAYGTLKYGVNVGAGNVDGDGYDELLTGPGPGASFASQIRGFNYDDATITPTTRINFAPNTLRYGINVAGGDADADGFAEIACAPGPGPVNPSRFQGYDYDNAAIAPLAGFDVTPFPATLYGGRLGLADILSQGRWDLLSGAGRDPAADSTVLAFDYDGTSLLPLSGSGFQPFAQAGYGYGVNVSGGELGL